MISIRRRVPAIAACLLIATVTSQGQAQPSRDPLRSQQWGLDQVHAPTAWKVSRGAGVTVAVVDSGVDFGHPDLRGALLPGKDFSGTGIADDCGHGTEVIGVIAARRNNGIGIAGVAPEAKVMPLKDGNGCTVDIQEQMAAIRYAADHGARVVNISQGTQPVVGDAIVLTLFAQQEQAAVDYAWARGTLVVAGAGNSTIPICGYPAALHHVICVGAVGQDRQRSYYSQSDVRPDVDFLMAPAGGGPTSEGTWTTSGDVRNATAGQVSDRGYTEVIGTSFATPFVAGVAALMFGRGFTLQQVHDRLLSDATDLGPPGRDAVYGWGEVDASSVGVHA